MVEGLFGTEELALITFVRLNGRTEKEAVSIIFGSDHKNESGGRISENISPEMIAEIYAIDPVEFALISHVGYLVDVIDDLKSDGRKAELKSLLNSVFISFASAMSESKISDPVESKLQALRSFSNGVR